METHNSNTVVLTTHPLLTHSLHFRFQQKQNKNSVQPQLPPPTPPLNLSLPPLSLFLLSLSLPPLSLSYSLPLFLSLLAEYIFTTVLSIIINNKYIQWGFKHMHKGYDWYVIDLWVPNTYAYIVMTHQKRQTTSAKQNKA